MKKILTSHPTEVDQSIGGWHKPGRAKSERLGVNQLGQHQSTFNVHFCILLWRFLPTSQRTISKSQCSVVTNHFNCPSLSWIMGGLWHCWQTTLTILNIYENHLWSTIFINYTWPFSSKFKKKYTSEISIPPIPTGTALTLRPGHFLMTR